MGPVLGEHLVQGRPFNPEDGRITHLELHRIVDNALGHALHSRTWWRLHEELI